MMRLGLGGMKLKERLLLAVSAATVLFTLLLVVDLQMDAGVVGRRFLPTHQRVKLGGGKDPEGAVYNGFRNRLLQKMNSNTSRETQPGSAENRIPGSLTTVSSPPVVHDHFNDLVDYMELDSAQRAEHADHAGLPHAVLTRSGEGDLVRVSNPTLAELHHIKFSKNDTVLTQFHLQIAQHELYPENSRLVGKLLKEMATKRILHVAQKTGGTQIKLVIDYPDDESALFKPMR